MDEYIQRDDALDIIRKSLNKAWADMKRLKAVNSIPGPDDVVPVIRCRNCKHFEPMSYWFTTPDGNALQAGSCGYRAWAGGVKADEAYFCVDSDCFCSFARRKDEVNEAGEHL